MSARTSPVFHCPLCRMDSSGGVISFLTWARILDRPEQHERIHERVVVQASCLRKACGYREVWTRSDLKNAGFPA